MRGVLPDEVALG